MSSSLRATTSGAQGALQYSTVQYRTAIVQCSAVQYGTACMPYCPSEGGVPPPTRTYSHSTDGACLHKQIFYLGFLCAHVDRPISSCNDVHTAAPSCRPVLSFDGAFDEQPHLQLLKEMLGQVFGTPSRHHKAKPFFDHIFSFSVADGCIWMRNYQVGMGHVGTEYRKGWGGGCA